MATPRTTEEIEYKNLKNYLLTLLGFAAAFAGWIVYLTFEDRKAIKEDYEKTIIELKGEIKELKTDTKESISNTNRYAQEEISRIKFTTNQIALEETEKQLSNIFGTDKIKNLIQDEAVKEVKNKVLEIVDEETKNIIMISDAGNFMRAGNHKAYIKLSNYSKNSENERDKRYASSLLNEILSDYYLAYKNASKQYIEKGDFHQMGSDYGLQKKNQVAITKDDIVHQLVRSINYPDLELNALSDNIMTLVNLTGVDFKLFEIDKINEWYKNWEKTHKKSDLVIYP